MDIRRYLWQWSIHKRGWQRLISSAWFLLVLSATITPIGFLLIWNKSWFSSRGSCRVWRGAADGPGRSFGGEVRQNPSLPVRYLKHHHHQAVQCPVDQEQHSDYPQNGDFPPDKGWKHICIRRVREAGRRSCRGYSGRMQRTQWAWWHNCPKLRLKCWLPYDVRQLMSATVWPS